MQDLQLINLKQLELNVAIHMATIDDESVHANQMMHSIMLVGAPGTAKTRFALTIGRKLWAAQNDCQLDEVAVIVTRCAGRDAVEFIGMGVPQKEVDLERYKNEITTRNSVPDLLVQIEMARQGKHDSTNGKKAKAILLILDEVLQGDQSVQKTLSSLLYRNENTLGGFDAGQSICVIGTGNGMGDKSGATKMLAMNRDRVVFYQMEGYTDKSIGGYIDYLRGENGLPLVHPALISYLESNLKSLPFDSVMETDRSHMTFRSYFMAAKTISTWFKLEAAKEGNHDVTPLAIPLSENMILATAATIGVVGAKQIEGYLENLFHDVPSKEDILANPATASVPEHTGAQANAGGIAALIVNDAESAEAAMEYVSRLRPDLQVQFFADILNTTLKGGYCLSTDQASQFIGEHSHLLTILEDS